MPGSRRPSPDGWALPRIVVVTGTGTGVGKTMVTAALATQALVSGRSVCVVKPVQTGVPGAGGGPVFTTAEPADIDTVRTLLGPLAGTAGERLRFEEYVRLPEALAPQRAAALARVGLPPVQQHAARIAALAHDFDLILVEGAGGVLVRLDDDGGTIADLARLLPGAQVVVVTRADLGTLNATELTVEALRRRDVPVLGLVIGCLPAATGPESAWNSEDLPAVTGVPLLGSIPERRGGWTSPPVIHSDGGRPGHPRSD